MQPSESYIDEPVLKTREYSSSLSQHILDNDDQDPKQLKKKISMGIEEMNGDVEEQINQSPKGIMSNRRAHYLSNNVKLKIPDQLTANKLQESFQTSIFIDQSEVTESRRQGSSRKRHRRTNQYKNGYVCKNYGTKIKIRKQFKSSQEPRQKRDFSEISPQLKIRH